MIEKDDIEQLLERLSLDETAECNAIPEGLFPPTNGCISPIRTVNGMRAGFTAIELDHIPGCAWCQRTISNNLRLQCPARWRVLRAVLAPKQEPLAEAILLHLGSHGCLKCGTLATGAASFICQVREAVGLVFEQRVLAPQGTGFKSGQEDYEPVELASTGPVSVVMKRSGSRLYLTAKVDPPDSGVTWVEVLLSSARGLERHRIDVEMRYGVQQGTDPLGETRTWLGTAGQVEIVAYYGSAHV